MISQKTQEAPCSNAGHNIGHIERKSTKRTENRMCEIEAPRWLEIATSIAIFQDYTLPVTLFIKRSQHARLKSGHVGPRRVSARFAGLRPASKPQNRSREKKKYRPMSQRSGKRLCGVHINVVYRTSITRKAHRGWR